MKNFEFLSVIFFAVYILLVRHGTGYQTDPNLSVLYRRGDIHVVPEIIHFTLTAHIVSDCELSLEQQNITKSDPVIFEEKVEECFHQHQKLMSFIEKVAAMSSKENFVSFPETIKVKSINETKIIRTFSLAQPELNFGRAVLRYYHLNLEEEIDSITHVLVRALDDERIICNGNCRSDLAFIQSYRRDCKSQLPYAVTFTFDIIFPVVDPQVLSVSLDPFTIVREVELPCTGSGNKLFCKWKYNGPHTVLVDVNNSDCVLQEFWNSTGKTWLSEESLRMERDCMKWSDLFSKSNLTCYSEDFTIPTEKKILNEDKFYNCPRRREFPCCYCREDMTECPDEVFHVDNFDRRVFYGDRFKTNVDVIPESLMNMKFPQPEILWPDRGSCDRVGIVRFIFDYYYKY